MNEYTQQEVDRLHSKLASIYRRGELTAGEKDQVRSLWARIERLETTIVRVFAREAGEA